MINHIIWSLVAVDFTVMEGVNIKPLLGMNILNKLNIYKIDLENYKIHLKD